MFTAIALAVALSAPPEQEQRGDCNRPKVEQVKHRSKPVRPKYRPKRLFRTDPKVEEDPNCESILAPFTASLDRASTDYSPVLAVDLPVPPVPGVAEGECGCFGATVGALLFGGSPAPDLVPYAPFFVAAGAPLAPVPEPEPFWLLSLGGVLMFIKSRASARGQRPEAAITHRIGAAHRAFFKRVTMNNIQSPRPVTDETIEEEIVRKGKTAPRITPMHIEEQISGCYIFTADKATAGCPQMDGLSLLTICVLVLKNGFTIVGKSACASPENFDAEIGAKIARQDAVQQIWALEGYALKTMLVSAPAAPGTSA